jgi:hypothetical protein
VRSTTTPTGPAAAANPARASSDTAISSRESSSVSPSTAIRTRPSLSSSRSSAAPSASPSAAFSFGMRLPTRGPSARKFGFTW